MGSVLFYDGVFHSGLSREDSFYAMEVAGGKIVACYKELPGDREFKKKVSLGGQHVYPCLIDAHVHLLLSLAVMAMGFSVCRISSRGVEPNTISGVEQRIRQYAAGQKKDAVIAANNYILSALDQKRLPSRQELDDWAGGRAIVVYNIDGHSCALSSEMLRLLGIEPEGHSGVLQGEESERVQGRLTDIIASRMSLRALARGFGSFQNACARYGIGRVGALEGNGDSPKDMTTALISQLARRMDIGVSMYYQYMELERAQAYGKYQRHRRVGGCGDWEMDGAIGAHSAAFYEPYKDSGETSACYYEQEKVDAAVKKADSQGYQIASHAIGQAAIDRAMEALDKAESGCLHRIEHCEFPGDEAVEKLKKGRYALVMQPGYAWIDKRYLHTYEQFLPEKLIKQQHFRSFYEAGVCLCGSSDSPVQELDPYLQMMGMVQHYIPEESVSVYEAFRCYTINPAQAMQEDDVCGSLEVGKRADFFTADEELFQLPAERLVDFCPRATYYGGEKYREKKGTVAELLGSFLKKPKLI